MEDVRGLNLQPVSGVGDPVTSEEKHPVCGFIYVARPTAFVDKQTVHALRVLMGTCISVLLVAWVVMAVMLFYPFKTVDIVQPIEVINPHKTVQLGGVVKMEMHYRKYVDVPAVVIKTLVRADTGQTIDSQTNVSLRPSTNGKTEVTETLFVLPRTPEALGKCRLIITTQHTLFGFRMIPQIFETDVFDVVMPPGGIPDWCR